MELLLPVALKLFPNMLPSTFEGQFAAVSLAVLAALTAGRETTQASASANRDGKVPAGDCKGVGTESG